MEWEDSKESEERESNKKSFFIRIVTFYILASFAKFSFSTQDSVFYNVSLVKLFIPTP